MILVLVAESQPFETLFTELEPLNLDLLCFDAIAPVQQWLELNNEPAGLIVDLRSNFFQDFLIRFSLRFPEVPVLSLKEQPNEQQKLRLIAFKRRIDGRQFQQQKTRILLVDDSKTIQVRYRKLLEAAGYAVDLADDAESGFNQAIGNNYDLAIIDYFMPGDTGAQLCARLQKDERTYELATAILTAEYKENVVDECIRSGAKECMFKNESADLFLTRVKSLTRSVESKNQIGKERSRLIGLLNSVAEGVFGVTPDGRLQFVNPATLKLLGQSMSELMGHYPHDCIHPIDNSGENTSFDHCFLQQAYLLGDELRDWRTLFQRADGSVFPVECSVTCLGDSGENAGSVVVFRDISEQQRLEKNWLWQLNHDHLTGLLNRVAFEEMLNRELNRIRRTKEKSLLLFIDLDKFKMINDELGHAAGDQLLITLAENLSEGARDTDHVGRLSGDEFLILLTHVHDHEYTEVIERYRELLEETSFNWNGKNYQITGSIGAVVLDQYSDSIGEILIQSDEACQSAKQKGRNQWAMYEQKTVGQSEQGNWYKRLTDAMQNQQFTILEHPIYSANSNERIGTNCLLRLKEGTALISPAVFMSNAKRFGVIKQIDEMVVSLLVNSAKQRKDDFGQWFSLTLSVDAISDHEFVEMLFESWFESNLLPENLRLEFSEADLFNFPQWKKHLAAIREKGFGIIISHFGMNSQSLLSLPQTPVDAVKLDTSLTRELATSLPRCNLIDAVVKTARQNKIGVIASHVESAADLELLQARDIDYVQGFYLKKPFEYISTELSQRLVDKS